eukprot:2438224-Pleurochrysis_carterae.AAC.1
MLIVIALLATRTAASPRVLPEARREQRASLSPTLIQTTARASLGRERSDLRLPDHLSTFSLAACDAEHVCCLYIANGRVILACCMAPSPIPRALDFALDPAPCTWQLRP